MALWDTETDFDSLVEALREIAARGPSGKTSHIRAQTEALASAATERVYS